MSPAHIRKRETKSGRRFDVRYRLGGREAPVIHAGTFRTHSEARARRDLVAGELAAGRDPRVKLQALASPPAPRTLATAYADFIASRIDVGPKTRAGYQHALARLGPLAAKDPHVVTVADWQTWVTDNRDLTPGTLGVHLSAHRQVLDHADVQPNTARSRKLKLPTATETEPVPPSSEEWAQIQTTIRKRSLLAARLIECAALRVSEAVDLEFGDVDFAEQRLRISSARTKRRTAGRRWIPIPPELLDEIADQCPLEDRTRDRKVFRGLTDSIVRHDLERACRDAGIAHYHPHDLRHRRISLWIAHGIDAVTVKTWAGHSRASMSTDTYGHVIVPGKDEWRSFWIRTYAQERLPREASVAHDSDERG